MEGLLRFNSNSRWEIVYGIGITDEITSGDVIEVWSAIKVRWERTRIEHSRAGYYAADETVLLYTGRKARLVR